MKITNEDRDITPKEYIKIEREQQAIMDLAESVVNAAYDDACNCPLPANLRRADFEDNIEGAVLWNPRYPKREYK